MCEQLSSKVEVISLSPASCKVSLEFLTTNLVWSSRKDMKLASGIRSCLKIAIWFLSKILKDMSGFPFLPFLPFLRWWRNRSLDFRDCDFHLCSMYHHQFRLLSYCVGLANLKYPQIPKFLGKNLSPNARCDSTDFDGYRATPSSSSSGTNSALLQDLGVEGLNLKSKLWKIEVWWNK